MDIAPTILDLAKVNIPSNIDGESIKQKLFSEHDGRFLKYIIIEYWGEGNLATVDPECGLDSDPNLAVSINKGYYVKLLIQSDSIKSKPFFGSFILRLVLSFFH